MLRFGTLRTPNGEGHQPREWLRITSPDLLVSNLRLQEFNGFATGLLRCHSHATTLTPAIVYTATLELASCARDSTRGRVLRHPRSRSKAARFAADAPAGVWGRNMRETVKSKRKGLEPVTLAGKIVVGISRQGRDDHLVGVWIKHQFQATDAAPVDDSGARRVIARRRELLTDRGAARRALPRHQGTSRAAGTLQLSPAVRKPLMANEYALEVPVLANSMIYLYQGQ
jgi:hypothetical protein